MNLRIQTITDEHRNEFQKNIRLAYWWAGQEYWDFEYSERLSISFIALMIAIQTHNEEKGTLATWMLYQVKSIREQAVSERRIVRIPKQNLVGLQDYVWVGPPSLNDKYGRRGSTYRKYTELALDKKIRRDTSSGSAPSWMAYLEDSNAERQELETEKQQARDILYNAVINLEYRECMVVVRCVMLGQKLRVVAKDWGLTRQRVEQIKKKALRRLHKRLHRKLGVEDIAIWNPSDTEPLERLSRADMSKVEKGERG